MKFLIPAAVASLFFNILLLASVVLDLEWAHTRAAGGQFDSFPIALRIVYLFMTLFMIYLINFIITFKKTPVNIRKQKFSKVLGYVFVLSTLTQLISRSVDERFNAIPAFIIAITLILLPKK